VELFFVIISSSGKEKGLPFDDQSGAQEHDHKQLLGKLSGLFAVEPHVYITVPEFNA